MGHLPGALAYFLPSCTRGNLSAVRRGFQDASKPPLAQPASEYHVGIGRLYAKPKRVALDVNVLKRSSVHLAVGS